MIKKKQLKKRNKNKRNVTRNVVQLHKNKNKYEYREKNVILNKKFKSIGFNHEM